MSRLVMAGLLVLVICVVGLSLALDRTIDTVKRLQEKLALAEPAHSPGQREPPPSTSPTPQEPLFTFTNVGQKALDIARANPDSPDEFTTLYSSAFGTIHLQVMGRGQTHPLHTHRITNEATVIVSGTPMVTHYYGHGGKPVSVQAQYPTGTVIASPPFCGQEWFNESVHQAQADLVFAAPSFDGKHYLKKGHEWLLKGKPPVIFNPEERIAALRAQNKSTWMEDLGYMGGRLASFAVATNGELGPFPDPTIIYVLKGRGRLEADRKYELSEKLIGLITANTRVSLATDGDTPLVILVFRPENDGLSDIIKKGRKRYSQVDEELLIREFFQDRKGGVFLDVGASHYKKYSTTFYLEEQLGWRGVAVDALKEYEAEYLKYRPNTKFVSYLVTDQSKGKQKFYRASGFVEVSSTSKAVTQRQARKYNGNDAVTEMEVPSITLNELLDQLKVDHIDFLSMDIEHHEPKALAGFDIERFKPELVCIEVGPSVRREVLDYFESHEYVRIDEYLPYDKFNWYFTPRKRSEYPKDPL